MRRKYNWTAAEQTFMEAPDRHPYVSLRDISSQFGIPYQTVRRYAAQNKWNSRRDSAYYQARKAKEPASRQLRYSTRGMPSAIARMLQQTSTR